MPRVPDYNHPQDNYQGEGPYPRESLLVRGPVLRRMQETWREKNIEYYMNDYDVAKFRGRGHSPEDLEKMAQLMREVRGGAKTASPFAPSPEDPAQNAQPKPGQKNVPAPASESAENPIGSKPLSASEAANANNSKPEKRRTVQGLSEDREALDIVDKTVRRHISEEEFTEELSAVKQWLSKHSEKINIGNTAIHPDYASPRYPGESEDAASKEREAIDALSAEDLKRLMPQTIEALRALQSAASMQKSILNEALKPVEKIHHDRIKRDEEGIKEIFKDEDSVSPGFKFSPGLLDHNKFKKEPQSENVFHNWVKGSEGNEKWLYQDRSVEIIRKPDGTRETDPRLIGTYNYGKNVVTHTILDVLPYIVWGNTPDDPTTPEERICIGIKGKIKSMIDESKRFETKDASSPFVVGEGRQVGHTFSGKKTNAQ